MSTLNNILDVSLAVPGVKIDRAAFLRKELSVYYYKAAVDMAIEINPSYAGISKKVIEVIANNCIKYHLKTSTVTSFVAGLPGGFAMLGTIPADMVQFYANIIAAAQKLAYLYGWPDLNKDNKTDELKNMLGLFLGVMMGVSQANKVIMEISRRLATEVAKRLPRKALTKYVWYNILKQVLRWLGVKLSKDTFAKAVSKTIPIVGGFISGTVTYVTMKKMCERLQDELRKSPLADVKMLTPADYIDPDMDIKVDSILDMDGLGEIEDGE